MCFGCSKEPSHWDGCSKEPSHWDGSFKYPQHMFWMRNKENNFPIRTLIWRPVVIRSRAFPESAFGGHRINSIWSDNSIILSDLFLSSADRFWKQFGPSSGLTKCCTRSYSKLFDILMVFQKEFFESYIWQISADDKKAWKKGPVGIVKCFHFYQNVLWSFHLLTDLILSSKKPV